MTQSVSVSVACVSASACVCVFVRVCRCFQCACASARAAQHATTKHRDAEGTRAARELVPFLSQWARAAGLAHAHRRRCHASAAALCRAGPPPGHWPMYNFAYIPKSANYFLPRSALFFFPIFPLQFSTTIQ